MVVRVLAVDTCGAMPRYDFKISGLNTHFLLPLLRRNVALYWGSLQWLSCRLFLKGHYETPCSHLRVLAGSAALIYNSEGTLKESDRKTISSSSSQGSSFILTLRHL